MYFDKPTNDAFYVITSKNSAKVARDQQTISSQHPTIFVFKFEESELRVSRQF
jgi:hypothetical protein